MAKKNFIPLCMMPFIANMMGGKPEEEGAEEINFVFSEALKYLINSITVEVNNDNRTTGYVEFNDDFWNQFYDDEEVFDQEKFNEYWSEHGDEYENTSIHFKLTNYVGNPEEIQSNTASWEFDVTFDDNFNEDIALSPFGGTPEILGTAECDVVVPPGAEEPGHLTGYSAVQAMALNATSCDFEVTIAGKSFTIPADITISEK